MRRGIKWALLIASASVLIAGSAALGQQGPPEDHAVKCPAAPVDATCQSLAAEPSP